MTEELEIQEVVETEETPSQLLSEVKILKEKADLMGINYPKNAGVTKMKELIEKHEEELSKGSGLDKKDLPTDFTSYDSSKIGKVKSEAFKLVRFQLIVNDPSKQAWTGMSITAGNDVVGTISRVIPFNTSEAWHAEAIIVEHMKNMRFQSFPSTQSKAGTGTFADHGNGKEMPVFTVIELPPLTEKELEELRARQSRENTGRSEDK